MTDMNDGELFERFAKRMAGIEASVKDPPAVLWDDKGARGELPSRPETRLRVTGLAVVAVLLVSASAVLLFGRKGGTLPAVGAPAASPTASSTVVVQSASAFVPGLDATLGLCGARLAGQNPVIGSFEAASPAALYERIPSVSLIPGLDDATGPIDVVLFGRGVFLFPVPLMRAPGSSGPERFETMLCVVRGGAARFYSNADFSGWRP
jgi:hypothetical protein